MPRPLRIGLRVVAALVFAALVVLWQWTHTPYGVMDPGPAVLVHLMPRAGSLDPEARARANAMVRRFAGSAVAPGVAIQDLRYAGPAGEQPLRLYTPEGSGPFPVVVWIHGGGFAMGDDLPIWDAPVSELAAQVPALVASVGYRLAPEHPFPAAVEDCWAGLQHVAAHAAEWHGDTGRLAVLGGSAGGNLAAVMAQRALDAGGPKLVYQVLEVPATLVEADATESRTRFAEGYGLDGISQLIAAYLPDPATHTNPWAAPGLRANLAGLPPALILTAEFDPLRDEGERYAERLREAGVPVAQQRLPGTIHGFLGSPGDRAAANAMVVEKLKAAFGS